MLQGITTSPKSSSSNRDSIQTSPKDNVQNSKPQTSASFMVNSITTLTTPHLVADVQGFFSEHPIPQSAKTLEQLLERQRVNAELRSREADALAAALTDK